MTTCTATTAAGHHCKNHAVKGSQLCEAHGDGSLDIRHSAPPGNTNALKHGFYRNVISDEQYARLITYAEQFDLGVDLLALVETNRFKYWQSETEYDDA